MTGVAAPMLKSSVTELGGSVCISLQGRIDGITSPDIERQMKDILLRGKRNLIIDFGQINYISSAGLRVFLIVQKQLKETGGEIVLAALPAAVREVFRVSGFLQLFRISESVESAASPQETQAAAGVTQSIIDSISFVHQKSPNAASVPLLSIGNHDKLSRSAYDERDVVSVTSSDITFGTGLATVGDTFNDYRDFFGEAVVIDRHIFFYPAARRPVVDFMIHADDQFQLTYRFFHGFGFNGPFARFIAFDGCGSPVDLTALRSALLTLTGARAIGVVLLAESKGIWGMHLKQVPTSGRTPANGEDIFAEPNFSQWFDFPVEPCDLNHIVAAVGLAARRDALTDPALKKVLGSDEPGHFHACIFQKDILGKNPGHFPDELRRVATNLTPLKVQNLLGRSAFSSGLVGIVDLGDVVTIRDP